MALDSTTFAFALKSIYTPEAVENLVYRDNPWLAMIPKDETFYGKNFVEPVIYGNPQGRSAVFATAQANKTSTKGIAFTITRAADYSLADIDNQTMLSSESDKGAFMEAATTEIDGALHSLARSLATAMYRGKSGMIGRISSGQGTATITLTNVDDITNFEVGMALDISPNSDGSSLRTNDGTLAHRQIQSLDRDAGTITLPVNWTTTWSAAAANDYIYVQGDATAKISGFVDWLPRTAPTSGDSFFGVDRSVDAVRLAGVTIDVHTLPINEGLIKSLGRVHREGGKPDKCFVNYANWANLEQILGSKVHYVKTTAADVGFDGIKVYGAAGAVEVYPDLNCQNDTAWILQTDTWKLRSLGKAPDLLRYGPEGLEALRNATADSIEIRCGYYAQMSCKAPGYNANSQLV